MLEGIDANQRIEFVSEYDLGETKTVFVLRPLNGEEKNNMQDSSGQTVKLMGTALYDFLEKSIVEIRNFDLGNTVREKLVCLKDQRVIAELVFKCGKLSGMTGQDAKN